MTQSKVSRRRLLFAGGVMALAAPILAACSGGGQTTSGGAQPTAASAAPTSASAAPTAASSAPAAQPTAAATQAAPAAASNASGQNVKVTASVQVGSGSNWESDAVKAFGKAHPNYQVEIQQIPNDQNAKKLLALLATKTLPDVAWVGVKYFGYTASKGAFLAMDPYVKQKDPGLDDYFPASIDGCKFEGKLMAMPVEINTGNTNVILYNKDLLDAKGIKEPTDDWTFDDFASAASKLTDKSKHVWGTNLLPTNYYDLDTWTRSLGGEILAGDGKQFALATDPKALQAARWVTDLHTKNNAAPNRADSQGLAFPSGQIGIFTTGIFSMIDIPETVGNKFKVGSVLAPVGPDGRRGYELFLVQFSISAQTKIPDVAYDLMLTITSKETSMDAFIKEGETVPRKSVWESDEAKKIGTIFSRASAWLSNGKDVGPFPMPNNLRFSELQDKFGNMITDVYYGDKDFDSGIKAIQDECQKIVALPRA
ncbi:MAG TPA: extracellular solute-binding protein [Chloroflexota bacterium]|nr:extracellular solute-binding protein [Chloroflexota bacterium]